jgi:flagellar P-ring protein FlgI
MMRFTPRVIFPLFLLFLTCLPVFQTVLIPSALASVSLRLKDISRVKEVRYNQLIGYGLVVGLSESGDSIPATQLAEMNLINNMGGRLNNPSDLRGKNVAQVMLTALVPPFAKPGDRLDVLVSSVGNAKSLEGGVLLSTQLNAPNGEVVAVAQGPISTGGVSVGGSGSSKRTAITTSARVPQGAIVEREIVTELGDSTGLDLILNRTDFTIANTVAETINGRLAPAIAVDGSTIRVELPAAYTHNRVAFLAKLENLVVTVSPVSSKVVVNERTGTVVIGGGVRLLPAAVAHGGITVSIQAENSVSQPNALAQGQTLGVTNSQVEVTEHPGSLVKLGPTATLNDLVGALNEIGVTPNDLISILQALKAAGSLEAELEII